MRHYRRPDRTGSFLTSANRFTRLQFTQYHLNWALDNKSYVNGWDENYSFWSRLSPTCLEKTRERDFLTEDFLGDSAMFWGGVFFTLAQSWYQSLGHLSDVIILEDREVSFSHFNGDDFLLIHDNARDHSKVAVTGYINHSELAPWKSVIAVKNISGICWKTRLSKASGFRHRRTVRHCC